MDIKLGNINLHIKELVLHGVTSRDPELIRASIKDELTRLVIEQGIPSLLSQNGVTEHLDGGEVDIAPRSTAAEIGGGLAQKIYWSFEK